MAVRLARFLARAGASSRRGAADLVAAGRVRVNGRPPEGPGDPVEPGRDVVTVDGREVHEAPLVHLAFHKPVRSVTSRRTMGRVPTVFSLLGAVPDALIAVGRLDVMTEGLLLFTTDGELAARLMHPRWSVPRRYEVMVTGAPDESGMAALDRGVDIGEGPPVRPARWRWNPLPRGGVLELELGEGRSRVVRRVCRALGLRVRRLARTAYGPVSLGALPPGASRPLDRKEIVALYRAVSLEPPANL
ncbi:MAG TPA: pseudouridine synthase [Gemmatimonadales bacterium]|nr:pseudouridine synthase [Gemmatimonadales bacterium]